MSNRFNNRALYYVELQYSDGIIEHQIAPGLFRQYIDDHLIVPKSQYRARVHPQYYAYIDYETNTLRFISIAELSILGGGSVAFRYFLLWLYAVKHDRQHNPIYVGLYQQHDQMVTH